MSTWNRDARIRLMHKHGWSQRDIAGELGVSQMTVCREMKRLGLQANGHWSKRARKKRRKVLKYWCWKNGMPSLAATRSVEKQRGKRPESLKQKAPAK